MQSQESYRASLYPDLTGWGAVTARVMLVAGPAALMGAELAARAQSVDLTQTVLGRLAVPLMLAWAAVLFLLTRAVAPVAAWTGLAATTVQLTFVQQVASGWVVLLAEAVAFVAFAVALWRVPWVPRYVPLVLLAFPVVDVFSPEHSNVGELTAVAMFVVVSLVLATRWGSSVRQGSYSVALYALRCSPHRACSPGRTCCTRPTAAVPDRHIRPLV